MTDTSRQIEKAMRFGTLYESGVEGLKEALGIQTGKMYTIEDIQKLKPCKEYTREKLENLWEEKESLALREILELDIDIDDRNWVVPQLVSTEVVVTWAQYCADEAEKHANVAASARCAAHAARSAGYAARSAANAADAAWSAAHAARYAANAAADAGSAWSKNRDTELYKLLTILCNMEEESTWKEYNSQESIIRPL